MNSNSARLTCYLPKALLNRDFLDIYLTTFLGVRKLKNTAGMRLIFFFFFFFLKMFKIEFQFTKGNKNSENILCLWDNCI